MTVAHFLVIGYFWKKYAKKYKNKNITGYYVGKRKKLQKS